MISDPLRDVFNVFDPLGMLLRVLCSSPIEGIFVIFGCIFEFSFVFLAF